MKFLLLIIALSSNIALSNHLTTIKGKNGRVYHTGLIHDQKEKEVKKVYAAAEDCGELPEEFDLRKLGTVPEIRDQGNCGSCWSFSETGSLNSAILAAGKPALNLSEQELVSCDTANYGCEGGNLSSYQAMHGQGLDVDFPYTSGRTSSNGRCKSIAVAAKSTGWVYVGGPNRSPTEKELKCALFKSKTIPWITVSANDSWGSFPDSEDKMYTRCGRGQTNHAVGVVGWKKINGKVGFIMKNSWGTEWGAKGYGVLPLGCDSFGDEVAYAVLKQ